ncbi:unnamed protein product [Peniophora sp. CBMAI 1063]|nr:unnamed protein product [Peniophora sp. CBMAI 1063]
MGMGQAVRVQWGFVSAAAEVLQAPKELGFKLAGHGEIAQVLKDSEELQQAAKHGSEAFTTWFPLAYYHLRRTMKKLAARDPTIAPPFPGSVYPTACANLGPHMCCHWHHDVNNYPGAPCWILALGNYNSKLGGHLVLPQLRMYIEFPAGASILLSSAGIKHGNTSLQPGEKRYSFTQYCPGGLLRYVAYGFRLAREVQDPKVRQAMEERAGETWKQQYARFSTSASLVRYRQWVRSQEALEALIL